MAAAERAGEKDEFRPLALFHLEDGNVAKGLRFARLDWEVRQDALAADTLAWALFRNEQIAEAEKLARRAVESGNKTPALLLHAGIILCHAGDVRCRPLADRTGARLSVGVPPCGAQARGGSASRAVRRHQRLADAACSRMVARSV